MLKPLDLNILNKKNWKGAWKKECKRYLDQLDRDLKQQQKALKKRLDKIL